MKCNDCSDIAQNGKTRCEPCAIKRRNYTAKNADRMKGQTLMRKYGITLEQYFAMHEDQSGLCAICLRPERASTGRYGGTNLLAVDHCHATGKVRGLLCRDCNVMLGKVNDDPLTLLRAAAYLQDMGIYY